MVKKILPHGFKLICWLVLVLYAVSFLGSTAALALSKEQKSLFYQNILYYDRGCSPTPASPDDSALGGTVQELAQQILSNSNISYYTNDEGINTRDVVVALSQGKKAYTTAPDGQPKTAEINPYILMFILDAAKEGKLMVNALTDKDHSSTSNHYKGLAVDLDNNSGNITVPLGSLIKIAKKYHGKKNSESDHYHFDFLKRPPPGEITAPGSTGPGGGPIKKVFMVGDSITYTAALPPHNLGKAFKDAGIEPVISGSAGGNIDRAGTEGDPYSGLEAITKYKSDVKDSGGIVVAHGTNHFPSEMSGAIKRMIKKIKSVNDSAQIFWVNTYTNSSTGDTLNGQKAYTKESARKKNNTIASLASRLNYQIIDITSVGIKLNSDGVHPEFDESGMGVWRDTVVKGVSKGVTSTGSPSVGANCGCPDLVALSGDNNVAKALGFFVSQGFSIEVAAGIVGNFIEESGVNPRIVEGGGESDTVPPPVGPQGQPGYGIAQWTSPDRKENLKKFAAEKGMPVNTLELQLLFVMEEMKSYGGLKEDLMNIKGTGRAAVEDAALLFHSVYEGSADTAEMIQERVDSGMKALEDNGASVGVSGGGGGGGCAAGSGAAGEVIDGIAWPVPKKWWDDHPEYFTGPHHDYPAVDIAVPTGTEVFSMLDGSVVSVESSGACGGGVIIDSPGGIRITYCHGPPDSVKVNTGDKITAGQQIMSSNDTGSSTGPHLHVQIDVNGSKVCPQNIFKNLAIGKGTDIKNLPSSGCTS